MDITPERLQLIAEAYAADRMASTSTELVGLDPWVLEALAQKQALDVLKFAAPILAQD